MRIVERRDVSKGFSGDDGGMDLYGQRGAVLQLSFERRLALVMQDVDHGKPRGSSD
jgi:hypothetical protein